MPSSSDGANAPVTAKRGAAGWAAAILVGAFPVAWAWGVVDMFTNWSGLVRENGPLIWWVLGTRLAVLSFGLIPLGLLAARWKNVLKLVSGRGAFTGVRWWVYGVFAAAAVSSLGRHFQLFAGRNGPDWSIFLSFFILFQAAWTQGRLIRSTGGDKKPAGRPGRVDLVLANVLFTLVLLEALVSAAAAVSSSPLFWETQPGGYNVARQKPNSRRIYFGKPFNGQGYYDDEFFPAEKNDFVVAVLCDSFGVGQVPHAYNFTTAAEKLLRAGLPDLDGRVAVNNYGVCNIGLPEYFHILQTEVRDVNPNLVVLGVFVGNDLLLTGNRLAWRKYVFQNWWLWRLAHRLILLRRQASAGAEANVFNLSSESESAGLQCVLDPSRETPTFTEEKYLDLECERMSFLKKDSPTMAGVYAAFFSGLKLFSSTLGNQLLVVIIPDEYQVNDGLFAKCLTKLGAPEKYRRDYPQERIVAFCRENGIQCLDLLPALREAEQGGRTYHLRDTHWNARGNQVAGEAIATYILAHRRDWTREAGFNSDARPLVDNHENSTINKDAP
ncbi:MAG: hypothetical protein V1816_10035 [Pseudomonadota bacterium]